MDEKILVIDDDSGLLTLLRLGLERDGFTVITANSGKEGLRQAYETRPDVIVLDVMMPGMDGWKVFDKLKENQEWKNIPVVFFTMRKDKVAEKAGMFLGEDYIEKPFEIMDLKRRIDKVLKKTSQK